MILPKRKFFLTNGATTFEVFPKNQEKLKYRWVTEQDQIFKRKKLSGDLYFTNQPSENIYDFNYFKTLELTGHQCDELKIEVKVRCHGVYVSEWKGYFSTGAGKFDFDACIFQVPAEPDDKYRCILDNWNRKFNMFDFDIQTFEQSGGIVYEELTANTYPNVACDGFIRCAIAGTSYGWFAPTYSSAANMTANKWCIKSHTVTPEATYKKIIVFYDTSIVGWQPFDIGDVIECVGFGNSATICDMYEGSHSDQSCPGCDCPFGDSCEWWWLILKDITDPGLDFQGCNNLLGVVGGGEPDKAGNTCAEWQDEDYCSVVTVWESQLVSLPCVAGSCPATPAGHILVSTDCSTTGYCTYRRCPTSVTTQEYRGVLYTDMIDGKADEYCGIDLSSIFFDYNPDTTDPHYSAGINYVTGATNLLAHIMISQQSDVIDPNASNPATIGMLTLKQLLDWARETFVAYWDIRVVDGQTVLVLEHVSFFQTALSIDFTLAQFLKEVRHMNKYEHLQLQIPQYERFKWQEAGGEDFIGRDIIYSPPCARTDSEVSHNPEQLSTDFLFITLNTSLSQDGFVMTNPDLIAGDYVLHAEAGILSGFVFDNCHLSWANLHQAYHRWNRFLEFGNMNDVNTTFISWQPNIKQVPLNVNLCCEDIPDTSGHAITELGGIIGANGIIDEMEQSFKTSNVKFNLTYSI